MCRIYRCAVVNGIFTRAEDSDPYSVRSRAVPKFIAPERFYVAFEFVTDVEAGESNSVEWLLSNHDP
jgi:hypothetical protein